MTRDSRSSYRLALLDSLLFLFPARIEQGLPIKE
jgi:hypothetical protein